MANKGPSALKIALGVASGIILAVVVMLGAVSGGAVAYAETVHKPSVERAAAAMKRVRASTVVHAGLVVEQYREGDPLREYAIQDLREAEAEHGMTLEEAKAIYNNSP